MGGGLSYGYFEIWNWDIDNPKPPQIYRSPKINALAGLEIRLTRRVNLEGVIKAGRLTQTNWIQPSLQGSVTIYLGKQYQSLK
ncbi:hypothetical protein QE357_004576 [Siphonobacter sp. BAB-5404]|nr:hypothetical protein [Siphonobacter sp. SORGH_AS_0500]